jgi:hypothetical protein
MSYVTFPVITELLQMVLPSKKIFIDLSSAESGRTFHLVLIMLP